MPKIEIDFRVKEERDTEDWWVDELQNDIEEKFNSISGPYWRVTLFISFDNTIDVKEKDNYLLFTFHHAVFDGAAIMAFYQKFLKVYAFLDEGGVFDDQQIGKIIPFTEAPPINSGDVCEKKIYWWTLVKTIFRYVYYFYFTNRCVYDKSRWIKEGYTTGVSEEAHTTLLPFKLEAEDLNALKVACKKRNVTLHSAVVAATQLAFKETYQGDLLFNYLLKPITLLLITLITLFSTRKPFYHISSCLLPQILYTCRKSTSVWCLYGSFYHI